MIVKDEAAIIEQCLAAAVPWHDLRTRGPRRAKDWARDAVLRLGLGLEVSWAVSADRSDAKYLEDQTVAVLRSYDIWNR